MILVLTRTFVFLMGCMAASAWAAEPAPGTVVATMGKATVEAGEVLHAVAKTPSGREADAETLPALQARILELVIDRRLAAGQLTEQGYAVSKEENDELVSDLKRRLAAQSRSFEEFLDDEGLTEAALRRQLVWDVIWDRYLGNELTDKAFHREFDSHRREYDGTELRVSHILLRVENPAKHAAVAERAGKLRSEIVEGHQTFADAAAKHSAGPSRRQGGDLGFIPRHDRMSEDFSRAAFSLEQGEISEPVTTRFGVHLIQCTDVKPGKKTWSEARRALAESLSRRLFAELALAGRKRTTIRYTGAMPYFEPGTKKLQTADGGGQ
ncbi:MAG TPA: peptidylprolyl isomerase [Pirellulales bacterium]|nr:peptidylprolyl isomerase [Pirellulales bacterium]